jgi:hypothetical protein
MSSLNNREFMMSHLQKRTAANDYSLGL